MTSFTDNLKWSLTLVTMLDELDLIYMGKYTNPSSVLVLCDLERSIYREDYKLTIAS